MSWATMLNVGQSPPDFAVQDHEGKLRKLADFAGRPLVVWFYPAADTPG